MSDTFGQKKNAVLTILRNQDRFLMIKRERPPHVGRYVPVGGKIDPHESPAQAAIREAREESGIVVSVVRFCGVLVETSPAKYNWTVFVYIADVDNHPARRCNEGQLEWVEIERLKSVSLPETDLFLYDYVLSERPFMMDAHYDAELKLLTLREEIEGKILKNEN